MSSGGRFDRRTQQRAQPTVSALRGLMMLASGLGYLGALGAIVLHPETARAEPLESAPPQVRNAIERMEAAANARDLSGLMGEYAPNFSHDDGLDRDSLRETTEAFWDRYGTLTYDIELLDWEATDDGYITETEVTVVGFSDEARPVRLESALRSRQTLADDRILRQTTLEEASVVTVGENPPTIRVQLPDSIAPGDRYEFDAIVLEPIGNDFLLGGALDETVDLSGDREVEFIAIEPLSAGGLFKAGTAPLDTNDLWLSAAVIRKDGISIVTQRLPLVLPEASE